MKKYIIVAILAILAYKWIETNPFSQFANTGAQSAVYYSQAELQAMQAAQIQQNIRRQNEMDNGLGMNMNARIVTGKGITDAEQVSSTFLVIGGVVVAAGAQEASTNANAIRRAVKIHKTFFTFLPAPFLIFLS